LANFQLDQLFDLSQRDPGTPMFKLRQKLQTYFGMDLPLALDPHTPSLGPSTNTLHKVADTIHSQSHLNPSRTGSLKQLRSQNLRRSDPISLASAAITLIAASLPPSSKTSELSECSVAHSASLAPLQFDLELKLPKTFSHSSSARSTTTMMMSTSELHSQQPLLDSSVQANSHGIPGIPPHTFLNSLVDQSNSLIKASFSIFPNPRLTNSEVATTFHYLPLETPAVQFEPSGPCFSAIPNRQRTRSLQHPVARSAKSGLRTNSHRHYLKPVSTLQHTLVTPSVVEQQIQPSQQEYLEMKSKEWVGGSQMQWTDISLDRQHRLNSFPPTGGSMWPPRVRRAPSDSLPALAANRTDPRNSRTPGLAFQRGCLAADTVL
jgi:hypothetical protein